VAAARAYGLYGGDDALLVLLADALHRFIDLFRSGHAAARSVHVQHDGLDGIVFAKLLEFLRDGLRLNDHAFQIDNADLVAEGELGVLAVTVRSDDQEREYCNDEEKECATAEQQPEPQPRLAFCRRSRRHLWRL